MIPRDLKVEDADVADLRPYAGNARTHSKKQIQQIARSIERFGFTNPIGMSRVPTLRLSRMGQAERRA